MATTSASAPPGSQPATRPSGSLVAQLARDLAAHAPFAQMATADLHALVAACEQAYYAPGEVLVDPNQGVARHLFVVRQGVVAGVKGMADLSGGAFQFEAGDMFPVSAVLAQRAVTSTYRAVGDCFVLRLPLAQVQALIERSGPWADFLNRRVRQFLDLSRQALQVAYASQALSEQSLEAPLASLLRRPPVHCAAQTPLAQALATMQSQRLGCMLVTDEGRRPLGILTRGDVLGRVTLAGVGLDTPIGQVMVQPVHTLHAEQTAEDAALLMSRHHLRHVPVVNAQGELVGLVSERDLFALQRLSLKQVSSAIRAATDVAGLRQTAQDIRRFARSLLSQGVQARQLTALISHLNDVLAQRLVELHAHAHGVHGLQWCWIALGSEGRSEQTISTDQDNALILGDSLNDETVEQLRAMARDVNEALDACGYPLCKGGVMAREDACFLRLSRWRECFEDWIAQGSPKDLLNASIYFDFRAVAGQRALADALRQEVTDAARRTPRFVHQMAVNALDRPPPLNWMGALATDDSGQIDLKLQGTAMVVDAARIYALIHGLPQTNTRERLLAACEPMGVPPVECEAWVVAFEFLQMLRLRRQLDDETSALANPNAVTPAALNEIDRRMLKEAVRVVRGLQQRLQLDFVRR
jgi:CBS domain-containing protein